MRLALSSSDTPQNLVFFNISATIQDMTLTMIELLQLSSGLVPRGLGLGGRGEHLVLASCIGPILACLLVFNRAWWRITLTGTLGLDDLCVISSLVPPATSLPSHITALPDLSPRSSSSRTASSTSSPSTTATGARLTPYLPRTSTPRCRCSTSTRSSTN
jgi:hypothetical protein